MNQSELNLMNKLFDIHVIEGENSDTIGEDFLLELDIVEPDFLNEVVIDKLERLTFPDEINWNDLSYEYTVDFPSISWREDFLVLAHADILNKYGEANEDTIGDYFIKREYFPLLISNKSKLSFDAELNMTLNEYLEGNPDISYMELQFDKNVDVADRLHTFLAENQTELNDLFKQDMIEKQYPDFVTPDMAGVSFNVHFISDYSLLAENFIEEHYDEKYLTVREFLMNGLGRFLYENKELFNIDIMYDLEPYDFVHEL